MIGKIDALWEILAQFNINILKDISFDGNQSSFSFVSHDSHKAPVWQDTIKSLKNSVSYIRFSVKINRLMLIYPDLVKESEVKSLKYNLLCENAIVVLMTSFETYLSDIFKVLSQRVDIKDIEESKLKRFLRTIGFSTNYFITLPLVTNHKLERILPERIDFQDKDRCKDAFILFDISPPEIDPKIWNDIFTKDKKGYMKIRHQIIHKGGNHFLSERLLLNLEIVENCLKDIVKFVYGFDIKFLQVSNYAAVA